MAQVDSSGISACRVALIDDHEVVALVVAAAIEPVPGVVFVGVAPTVDVFEATPLSLETDLVVLDLRLADGSSPIQNVNRLIEAGKQVLAYTSGESPYLLRLAAQTPLLGLVSKAEPLERLGAMITRAALGLPVMTTEWAAVVESDPRIARASLSPQEQKVLSLFANGHKGSVVAAEAGIALGTVEDYIRRIRIKYARVGRQAHTKVDLYKRAVEDGLLPLPHGRTL